MYQVICRNKKEVIDYESKETVHLTSRDCLSGLLF